ncbi:NACHT, LRR and PYD domains-containing protein 12-like [Trichosurus vulpecula]|uniref:NACHT, LRR and PYD domains-containing protein 12-like n=1 Tax=Trichosurus vulpecula TaxID=9337 RepID=UPI00186B3A2F|nr:NACHT, LRR and PYD domains-containing protein 12-like [Trichosurus vulpecula]
MAETVRCRLVRPLEDLTSEELKKFKLYLMDFLPRGRLEEADRTKVADLLVSSLGEEKAWELALSIWEKMGLRGLCERARNEDLGLLPAAVLPAFSDERKKYQERMREKFQIMRDRNSRPGEQELFQHRFTQLLLLRKYRYKEQKQHELLVQGWEHAKVMEKQGQLIVVSALFDPDQNTGTQPRSVVLQGAAGIGKTTLAIKVMLDWAEGKLYQERFDYVFYLTCRELNPLGERKMNFADLIASDWPGPQAPMTEIMSHPERLLFIIDGLDELKFPCNEHRYDLCKDWKQPRPVPILLSSLLRKTMLPEASLLLTTRLTALGKFSPLLENPRHVEILGFSVEQRKEYFCKFFRDKDLGKKAFSLLEDNDALFTMCSVPLMNWIVCTCLKQQDERGQDPIQALKTTTALYMCYLSNLIIPDDKDFIHQHFRSLCGLAAEGIWGKKLLFEEEDLRRHNLEAVDVSAFLDMNIFQKDSDCENCYSFIHLSFQEFFAAMFYLMSSDKERIKSPDSSIPDIEKLLKECSQHDASFVVLVVRFLFGFLNAQTSRELDRKFRCRMSPEIKSQLLHWVEGETNRNYEESLFSESNFPNWYSLLYETQDAEFVTQALVNVQEIKLCPYSDYEILSTAFCIKHCPGIQRISFSSTSDVPDGIWQDFFFVVKNNQNLKELTLFCSSFVSACVDNLCVGLRNSNSKLETLRLEGFKVTYSCCQCLFSVPSLKSLHLRNTFFEDDGKKLPCETLGTKKSQLETLSLECCHLTFTCFQNLLCDLSSNERLKNLDLRGNSFEEGGLTLLCKFLGNSNCRIETLSLASCYLTSTYSENLCSALSSNKSLKNLDLSENFFEDRGIILLCKALGNPNCRLETLSLASCDLTSTCSQNLCSALSSNKSLKNLNLSGNSFEEREITLLCKALGNSNCRLETLRLAECTLTGACLQDLLPVVCSSENLKTLDLSFNLFGNEGVKLLCETLEKQDCKLQKLTFFQRNLSEESERALVNLQSRKPFLFITEKYEDATGAFLDWDAEDPVHNP